MPSYYDSTKKKPGTAKVKYEKGGEVTPEKDTLEKLPPRITTEESNRLWRKWVNRQIQEQKKEHEGLTASQIKALPKNKDLADILADKDGKHIDKFPNRWRKGDYAKGGKVKKMSEGGKVRGMGAATRGGNFSRNG